MPFNAPVLSATTCVVVIAANCAAESLLIVSDASEATAEVPRTANCDALNVVSWTVDRAAVCPEVNTATWVVVNAATWLSVIAPTWLEVKVAT